MRAFEIHLKKTKYNFVRVMANNENEAMERFYQDKTNGEVEYAEDELVEGIVELIGESK